LIVDLAEFNHSEGLTQRRELFDNAFPQNGGTASASVEHYRWKFHQAPVTPSSFEYAASEGDSMVGYYAAVPYRYRLGGRDVLAGMVCDVMTRSSERRKGVFSDLGRFALREMRAAQVGLAVAYPVKPEVVSGHLKIGWRIAFELPMYVRPLGAGAILEPGQMPWLRPVANGTLAAYRALLRARPASGCEVSVGPPRELLHTPAFAEFVERWSATVRNHLVKSADFYDWRLGAPGTHYEAFLVHREDAVVAAAVGCQSRLRGASSYALLDVMALKDERDALSSLYHEIDLRARQHGSQAVVTMMSRYRAREYRLARHGFLASPFRFKLIACWLGAEADAERILAEDGWHLMWIDSDDM
jgi:hypothetical protein